MDALGAGEDVVADARVRIALHLVEEQRGAAVEVLLDRGDLEMGIDLDVGGYQLAGRFQVPQFHGVFGGGSQTPPVERVA